MIDARAVATQTALAAAASRCTLAGETLTPLRRRVLELLLAQEGPAKAYDLLDALKEGHAGARPPTVYRALEFLVRMGLAHRIESLNAFMACWGTHGHAPALVLICARCGAAIEADASGAQAAVSAAAAEAGFEVQRAMIEATGLCATCAEAA